MPSFQNPILMFTALVALYSPVASLSSYFPVLRRLDRASQVKLSVALFIVVTLFALTAIWLGEPLLELLSLSGMAYAAVTALTIYASGHLQRRVQPKTRGLLERIAGILLVAIAVSLLTKGIPRLVVDTLDGLKAQRAGAASCKPTGDH